MSKPVSNWASMIDRSLTETINTYYIYENAYYRDLMKPLSFSKDKPVNNIALYHVICGNTQMIVDSYGTEVDAIARAERLASATPGIDFVVMKSISKSRATKPVETTRF